MFLVLVSYVCMISGQGSRNQMRGTRDLPSSDSVAKEGTMHIFIGRIAS
jgi:hypothetical protein